MFQGGFTIIETVLFLAISSLMILAAMNSVSGRSREVQFTDAVRSLESFFEGRINQVSNGSVSATGSECSWSPSGGYSSGSSDGSCVFLGYLFGINDAANTEVSVYQMFGRRIASNDPCIISNPNDPLFCAEPVSVPAGGVATSIDTFNIPWAIQVTRHEVSPGNAMDLFGYLRNPVSNELIPIAFNQGEEHLINTPSAYRDAAVETEMNADFSAYLCMSDGSRKAEVDMGIHDRQYAAEAVFGITGRCP